MGWGTEFPPRGDRFDGDRRDPVACRGCLVPHVMTGKRTRCCGAGADEFRRCLSCAGRFGAAGGEAEMGVGDPTPISLWLPPHLLLRPDGKLRASNATVRERPAWTDDQPSHVRSRA